LTKLKDNTGIFRALLLDLSKRIRAEYSVSDPARELVLKPISVPAKFPQPVFRNRFSWPLTPVLMVHAEFVHLTGLVQTSNLSLVLVKERSFFIHRLS